MLLLDHIVHFTEQLPEEIVDTLRPLNLNAVIGGSHEHWGTYNALLYTRDSYIEFLAVENKEIVKQSDHPLITHLKHDLLTGPGFGTICLRTSDIEALKEKLMDNGFNTSEVFQAQRRTAYNTIRKWKMLFIQEEIGQQLPFPFFIEWEEDDQSRFEMLRKDGTIQECNMNLSIETCVFSVADPRSAAKTWGICLGVSPTGSEENELRLSNGQIIFLQAEGKERLTKVTLNGYGEPMNLTIESGEYRFS